METENHLFDLTKAYKKAEISPVLPIDIDISKSNVVKLAHKEYVDFVEQENGAMADSL